MTATCVEEPTQDYVSIMLEVTVEHSVHEHTSRDLSYCPQYPQLSRLAGLAWFILNL